MAVDGGMGHRPAWALGLTWTVCPGQRASTEEKRFTDEACGQVIASPSLQLLNSSPLISLPASTSPHPRPQYPAYHRDLPTDAQCLRQALCS